MAFFDHDWVKYPELSNTQLSVLRFVSPHVQIEEDFDAVVVKVHDGDTVTLRASFRDFDFPLRLSGVDAPELSQGGAEVRDWLSARVLDKTVLVKINRFNRVGKYGRLIGELFVGGVSVGEEMVLSGLIQNFGKKLEGEIPSLGKVFSEGMF